MAGATQERRLLGAAHRGRSASVLHHMLKDRDHEKISLHNDQGV
jgi:hypothetical protein